MTFNISIENQSIERSLLENALRNSYKGATILLRIPT